MVFPSRLPRSEAELNFYVVCPLLTISTAFICRGPFSGFCTPPLLEVHMATAHLSLTGAIQAQDNGECVFNLPSHVFKAKIRILFKLQHGPVREQQSISSQLVIHRASFILLVFGSRRLLQTDAALSQDFFSQHNVVTPAGVILQAANRVVAHLGCKVRWHICSRWSMPQRSAGHHTSLTRCQSNSWLLERVFQVKHHRFSFTADTLYDVTSHPSLKRQVEGV